MASAPGEHYVYLYRERVSQKPRYVGYGMSPTRALSHAGNSHNSELRSWLEESMYDLQIAGPYRDSEEGLRVEAALISALRPTFNRSPGNGPKFRPVGVPGDLADRLTEEPLRGHELGVGTRGALLVYLSAGAFTVDGRAKVDPVRPETETIALNVEAWWQVDRYITEWQMGDASPRVLLGIFGPPRHRYIAGSFAIDVGQWGLQPELNRQGSLWRVPLRDRQDADAHGLRGRRVADVRFGRARWEHYRWIDDTGQTRHPTS